MRKLTLLACLCMCVSSPAWAQVDTQQLNSEYGPNSIRLNPNSDIDEPQKIKFYEKMDAKVASVSVSNLFYIYYNTPIGKVIPTENAFTIKAWSAIERVMQDDWTNPKYRVQKVQVGQVDVIKSGISRFTVTGQVQLIFGPNSEMTLNFTEVISNKIGKPVIEQIVLKKGS